MGYPCVAAVREACGIDYGNPAGEIRLDWTPDEMVAGLEIVTDGHGKFEADGPDVEDVIGATGSLVADGKADEGEDCARRDQN